MPFYKYKKFTTFLIIVAAISVFDLAIFMYLPLLSNIRKEFGVNESLIQFSVSINTFGIGVSSIIYGTLSDFLGRKKLIIFGIFMFVVASHCVSLTNSIYILFLFRFFQGIGSGVAWSLGNAVMHDIYKGKSFEKAIIILQMVIGITMVISPALGGYIGNIIGWRQSFNIMSILGGIILICAIFFLPETLQNLKSKIDIKKIITGYFALFQNSSYTKYLVIKVTVVSVAFVNITNLPLIFIEGHYTSIEYCANLMAFGSLIVVIGGIISNKLIHHFLTNIIIKYSLSCMFFSSVVLIIMEYFHYLTALNIQLIKIPYLLGIALIFGNATHKIVSAIPKLSGTASAIMITSEMLLSGLAIKLVSSFYNQTVYPIEIYTLIVTVISYYTLKNR